MPENDVDTRQNKAAETGVDGNASGEPNWLQITQQNYADSDTFLDANLRKQWARNLDLFHSRHPPGSKYLSHDYRKRSRIFRPKSRSSVRKNEAAIAAAFFSTADVVDIAPEDDSDPKQLANAQLQDQLLQYRLTRTIPWFQTVLGACQDAQVIGMCASKQYWRYQEADDGVEQVPVLNEMGQQLVSEEGAPVFQEQPVVNVVHDEPVVELIPLEYLRFHPSANWINPIQDSPYVIHIIPMFVHEVQDRAKAKDTKTGQPPWFKLDEADILKGRSLKYRDDETARERKINKHDTSTTESSLNPFEVVYVFENHLRWEGEDWVYYTLGDQVMLSDLQPLETVYLQGERPFVTGVSVIEAHRNIPSSKVQLTAQLQMEANDVANLRLDGVKFAMAGKWIALGNANVDLQAIRRNVPGSVVTTNDMGGLKWERPTDVSGSGFAEQDRINMDFDDLAGAFSSASVATNRDLNETVGGMQLLSGAANAVTELDLRVFSETWVKPVLRQLLKLEQHYETDEVILAVAAKKAKLLERFGVNEIDDDLMMNEVTLSVNVGVGAVDPMQKILKFNMVMDRIMAMMASPATKFLNLQEIAMELFGAAGYSDGARFFNLESDDMRISQLMQIIDLLQEELEKRDAEFQNKIDVAKVGADATIEEQRMEGENRLAVEAMKTRAAMLKQKLELIQGSADRTGKAAADARSKRADQGWDAMKLGLAPFLEPFEGQDDKAKAA